jgi:hypothetical protein
MDNFIFNPESKYSSENIDEDIVAEFFTLSGMEDFLDTEDYPRAKVESDSVFAKRTKRKNGTTKYTIRLSNTGKLYNPVSILGQETNNSFLNRVCRSNNKFAEVNQKVFNWYVKFLQTKNVAWLNNAEREKE